MFNSLQQQPADKILLSCKFIKKILERIKLILVSVFIKMLLVKHQLCNQLSEPNICCGRTGYKVYVGLTGTPEFSETMIDLVLGDKFDKNLTASAATPGGTGGTTGF